jgi:hypothetical protein
MPTTTDWITALSTLGLAGLNQAGQSCAPGPRKLSLMSL